MLKLFKFTLFGILGLILVLVIGGLLMSGDYKVDTSIGIDAAPEHIYADLAKLENWLEWSAWNKAADPECKHTFEGEGVGARWSWDGPVLMQGSMTLTKADPTEGIAYEMGFLDFPPMSGSMLFERQGASTRLDWSHTGTIPGIMGGWLAMVIPGQMQEQFDKGLAELKARAEKRAAASGSGKAVEAAAKKK